MLIFETIVSASKYEQPRCRDFQRGAPDRLQTSDLGGCRDVKTGLEDCLSSISPNDGFQALAF